MANATAPSARHTESIVVPTEADHAAATSGAWAFSRPLAALWAVAVALFVAFLAFGAVRVGAGFWTGRRMRLREIWTRFLGFLADQGASHAVMTGVTVLVVVSLVLAAIYLWLALNLRDADAGTPAVDAPER